MKSVNESFIFLKLRYDIYTIKYTDLKCTAWWVLIFGSTRVTNFSASHHPPRLLGAPSCLCPTPEFIAILIFSRLALPVLKCYINGLREYGFACVCFFHSTKCLWHSSMLLHVTIFSSFWCWVVFHKLLCVNIPQIISPLGPLWVKLLETFLFMLFNGQEHLG